MFPLKIMNDDHQSLMAALSENMLVVIMLLSVFFIPGDLDGCPNPVLVADIPKTIEALSGSCLQIPCSFSTNQTYDINKAIHLIWLKNTPDFNANPSPAIFNTSQSVNTYSLNVTGNLTEKNCTTVFPDLNASYTDTYYLRIENWPFMATDICCPLHMKVKDSPWSPSINVSSDLKEHQSVTATCSAFTPCPNSPPELTWNLQQDSLRQTEKNTDGTFTTKIQESITLSDTHDGYNITCSARYPVIGGNKTAETQVTLSVSYAPRNTSASIRPSGLVSAGSLVKLSCSSRAKPPPRFTWFRNSKHGAINVSVEKVYSFNATEGGEFHCVATNNLGNQTSSLISITMETKAITVLQWLPIVAGCICFICLMAVVAWLFKFGCSIPQKTKKRRNEDPAIPMRAEKTEEELYYGELNFLPASSNSDQDREQQETMYAEVKVSADTLTSLTSRPEVKVSADTLTSGLEVSMLK